MVREHEDMLRFWFDRAVPGVRIDSAALLMKDPALPGMPDARCRGEHPNPDRDEVHHVYRRWRDDRRLPTTARACWSRKCGCRMPTASPRYLRPGEMHTAFNFDLYVTTVEADEAFRASVDPDAGGPCAGGCALPLGAVQPRRDPAGHPLRPGGQLVRVREEAGSVRRAMSLSARAGLAPRRS